DPRAWPSRNCSTRRTPRPARASERAVAAPMIPAPTTTTSPSSTTPVSSHEGGRGHPVPQDADPLDLELDDVARPQPPAVAVLEDAARPHGARAEDVAGAEHRVPGGLGDEA